jgi:hypothetical protein
MHFVRGLPTALDFKFRKRMKAKPHPVLTKRREFDRVQLRHASHILVVQGPLHGARSAASIAAVPGRSNASCPAQIMAQASSFSRRASLSRAASFGAQLRSSLLQKIACIRSAGSIGSRRIAVQLQCPSRRSGVPVRSGPSSNTYEAP